MVEKAENAIENIMGQITCPKNFICLKPEAEDVCKVTDIGMDDYVECLEADPRLCQFSLPFGKTFFCKCKMRVYLCKKLGR